MRSRHDTITITSPQRRHHHPTMSGIENNNRIVWFRAMERATWPKRGTFHSEDYNRKPSDGLMMMNWNLSKCTHLKYDDVPFSYFNCILHRKKTKRKKCATQWIRMRIKETVKCKVNKTCTHSAPIQLFREMIQFLFLFQFSAYRSCLPGVARQCIHTTATVIHNLVTRIEKK